MISSVIFILLTALGFGLAFKKYKAVYQAIKLGRKESLVGDTGARWRNVLQVALGQKKMFKLTIPAVLHLFIYVAFLFTQIELIEIFIDGIFHTHRIFSKPLGWLYTLGISFIEILSVLAFVATIIFLIRRNILKISRFHKPELKNWPFKDANLILLGEILLLIGVFTMNGAEQALARVHGVEAYRHSFAISSWLGPSLFGNFSASSLELLERIGWWWHYVVVLGFIYYLPFSKHLHIFLAFPQTYFASLKPRGEMDNIPVITNEVKSMMGLATSADTSSEVSTDFGVKDVFDLPERIILSAFACTECGRCTAVCPANLTGKKLSPRKIMMDIRDRAEEIQSNLSTGKTTIDTYDDGKSLFSYISAEELHACTTCNACVEACPILINPLEPILEMRRYEILTESKGPASWTAMFTSLENSGCVWPMSESRSAWSQAD